MKRWVGPGNKASTHTLKVPMTPTDKVTDVNLYFQISLQTTTLSAKDLLSFILTNAPQYPPTLLAELKSSERV